MVNKKKYITYRSTFSGIAGTIAALGWGAYTYKDVRAGGLSKSLFFMQLRVKAQSMIVGAMTLGVAYSLLKDYIWHPKTYEELDKMYKHPIGYDESLHNNRK